VTIGDYAEMARGRGKKTDGPTRPRDTSKVKSPLDVLRVFDSLTVGPVKLERRRLVAPYTLAVDGEKHSTELIYTYEEDVFDPSEPESRNLASVIAAQVAVNYGLFCREMVFTGTYDENDRRFIRQACENTAREIYVKKFLEPNPFLLDPVRNLPALKLKKYLLSDLNFRLGASDVKKSRWRPWQTEKHKYAILSSGGKDSLLSYGLTEEIGREAHPIFINESGRHWFTALNAYNYFKNEIPNTARVWVNSDRVFAWVLRRMPWVRSDFADVRSDEYPIRLWTVAVFLMGAMPLIRKRGIGRSTVGDEFDTTHRTSYKGVTHYDGLYDQSAYFDNAISRYCLRKGWMVAQFSLVRPLSELLIEKILVERYPHLQRLQMSCHATHKEQDSVRPCGKCEKCRRIVGMLVALGADPSACGYTEAQTKRCLEQIERHGIAQEAAGVDQLAFMLREKGILRSGAIGKHHAAERPEVLKLRFDPTRSPINGIPLDLRKPLYKIFMEHAAGAVRRAGGRWIGFDPMLDPDINGPYAFETDVARKDQSCSSSVGAHGAGRHIWGELTWPESKEILEKVDVALLPVGSMEQHGPHLPLDTDAFDAQYLARRVAEACSDPKPLVLPLVPYGVSYLHSGFSGTISVTNDSLAKLVYDIGMSAAENGVKKLMVINAHGGNSPALNYAAQMINRDARIFVAVDTGETSDVDLANLAETQNDAHAGEIETSTSLAVRPQLVRFEKAVKSVPRFSSKYLDFSSKRGVSWHAHTEMFSPTGVIGDPTVASAEKGEQMWQVMIAHLVALVEDLKSMTLDEIYHRRY
jgi:creatinine amidohydrolase/Fe(II)-dependent formamide hydrolase-like protein